MVADLLRQRDAVHAAGHDDVAENEIDLVAAPQPVQRVGGVFRAQGLIPELLDERSGDVGDLGVVLDHQNGALAGHDGLSRRRLHALDRRRLPARQIDGDGCAAADRAGRNNGAARLMGKAVDLRQSETGAFPERFGREERLENPRQDVGRDADAGVCHRKGDEVSLKLIHRVAFLNAHVSRRQRD